MARTEMDVRSVAAFGLAPVWLSALAVALWAPALVTGSEQSSFPVGALFAPLAALVATPHVLRAVALSDADRPPGRRFVVGFLWALWGFAAVVAITSPETVTGSDPTRIPLAAMISPLVAFLVTRALHEWPQLLSRPAEERI